jgi:hypothetical protein
MKFKIDELEIGAIYLIDYKEEDNSRNYSGPGILYLTEGLNDLYFYILNENGKNFNLELACVFGLENIVRKIDLDSITTYL